MHSWATLLHNGAPEAVSLHRRRLSDEGAEAGLSRKQRQDRRKQQVSAANHDSRHQTPPLCFSQPWHEALPGTHLQ